MQNNLPDQIKQSVSIAEVTARYGFESTRKGYIFCPFHNEKTASLKIYEDTNSFYCFGCGIGGDAIDFVIVLFKLTYGQAVTKLSYDFGIATIDSKISYRQKCDLRETERKRKAERQLKEMRKAYSKSAYFFMCCYRQWLAKQEQTALILFDIKYIDRLLDKYLDPDILIDWDIKARLTALMSKHILKSTEKR